MQLGIEDGLLVKMFWQVVTVVVVVDALQQSGYLEFLDRLKSTNRLATDLGSCELAMQSEGPVVWHHAHDTIVTNTV